MTERKKDSLLSQIRFAYKKPIGLAEYSPEDGLANIAHVFGDRERAVKLLLLYLEEHGVVDNSGVHSEEKALLRAMLKG